MATQIRRRRRTTSTEPRRRTWPATRSRPREAAGVRRWQRHSGLSAFVWLLAWTATLVLLFGIALTWGRADPHNEIVHAFMRAGGRLATPFDDVFRNSDARKELTENWLFAAGVYLAVGRILAWLLRW